ncbi:MAG: alcohol dehydrogenase, partial [Planctomicrobium sp.]|nr:alcohol dehydrogenase [Planctomicrobium sp.]
MQKFLCLSFLVFLAVPRLFAEDWTQWRGPNRDGKIESKIHFTKSTQFKTEWTAEVGIGFSSMVVADVFLVTLGHADEQDKVTCLNALTGEKIWEQSYVAALDP